ncbi:divalent-cation tolerance protein CutA [Rhodanobacter sp. DHB23]|uniref:divalent-cation tolerance protein CutA n=1 Tax=Rhodanobacter sp. DHB23 TaxID=2775923 RepID=UPI00177B503F|nr:divalent-cation tolerance protein CutA [Rhodanobacter sp. DHB23]MBD8872177.1 divalent-cation tolerance protein CutA [Rhodanobacter sp. DHB23]
MSTPAILLCLCTCPDAASAQKLAETLVGERLAACVNRLPGVLSTYRWQGEVHAEGEELLLIKTTTPRFEVLKARLLELHPYELPELIALPIEHGHAAYLD